MDLQDIGAYVTEHWRGIVDIGATAVCAVLYGAVRGYCHKRAEAQQSREYRIDSALLNAPPEHRRSIGAVLEAGARTPGEMAKVYGITPPEHRGSIDRVLGAVHQYGDWSGGIEKAKHMNSHLCDIQHV